MKNYEIFHRSTFNKPNVSKQPGEQVKLYFINEQKILEKYEKES